MAMAATTRNIATTTNDSISEEPLELSFTDTSRNPIEIPNLSRELS
jgi:hypothetical protein